MTLDEELDHLDTIEFERLVEKSLARIRQLKSMHLDIEFISEADLEERIQNDKIFSHLYQRILNARLEFRNEMENISNEMKRVAASEMKKIINVK